jgi:hypothetical protein
MAGKLAGLRRRLEKAEKALAETVEQERLANCICKVGPRGPRPTIAISMEPEKFEAEMNQKCPVHGFRDLGNIIHMKFTDLPDERFRLDDLLDEYYARKSEYERAKREHDSQEA